MDLTVRIPAIEKLADYAASGIGSIAGPMLVTWKARKEAEAKQIAAKADAEILGILAGGQAEAMALMSEAQQSARRQLTGPGVASEVELTIADAIVQRVHFQEERRQQHILGIVGQAAEELTVDEVEDREPNHDWTACFFNGAQDVSSEEMQVLWAKVLAGEVERPGSTSIRTLGVLRELDRGVADTFQRLCSACVSIRPDGHHILDARVPSLSGKAAQNALAQYGFAFGNLTVLEEYGLIRTDYDSWSDYRLCIARKGTALGRAVALPLHFQNRLWALEAAGDRDPDQEYKLSGVALTKSGRELSRVVDLVPMPEYRESLVRFFETQKLRMVSVSEVPPRA